MSLWCVKEIFFLYQDWEVSTLC